MEIEALWESGNQRNELAGYGIMRGKKA